MSSTKLRPIALKSDRPNFVTTEIRGGSILIPLALSAQLNVGRPALPL